MEYDLPSDFDIIVVGTGMVESIVSAAASRIGKRVLHIDSNSYYGGLWASFNLDSIGKIAESNRSQGVVENKENEIVYPVGNDVFDLRIHSQKWHIPESNPEKDVDETDSAVAQEEHEWTQEKLLKISRKFNIDLAPKLHFAKGDFVELLISSNIARYSEFRSVSRILTWLNGSLEIVPCSRSDVFSSNRVSVIEKRMLMKLLTTCVDGDENEFKGYEGKTFQSYLKDRKLTENLIHYVLYAIAMCTDDTLCLEGVEKTKRFLGSLGRFGKTPFLYSMYGSGEITQAFCRLSAVFGGIYALNQPLNGFIYDNDNTFKGIICGKQRINATQLVMSLEKLPKEIVDFSPTEYISRAIFITDKSILEDEKEHLTLLLFPPVNGKTACVVLELGCLTGTCPKGLHIVHVVTKQTVNPEEDLKHCVEKLFCEREGESNSSPRILWSFYFSAPNTFSQRLECEKLLNTYVCPGPDLDLDYDPAIQRAKEIFDRIYSNSEFLPRAPDPEEIIIEGEDNNNIINETEERTEEPADRGDVSTELAHEDDT